MLKNIIRPLRYAHSVIREKSKSKKRSSRWDEVRDTFLESHPACAACGSTKKLQVHHIMPFHLYPELELEENNLIVLCMDVNECHLGIGHGGSFRSYNPKVVVRAKRFLQEKDPVIRKLIIENCKIDRLKT